MARHVAHSSRLTGSGSGSSSETTIKKVKMTGGLPETVCAVQGNARGATWSADGTIIFATDLADDRPAACVRRRWRADGAHEAGSRARRRRPPAGPSSCLAATPFFSRLLRPTVPSRTRRLRCWICNGPGRSINGSHAVRAERQLTARYVGEGGHLVYGVLGTLRAVAFDLGRREVVGTPVPVIEGVVTTASGAADAAVAANGSLVYVPGGAGGGGQQTIVSVDRQGRASPLLNLPPGTYRDVRVSPDGGRLALATLAISGSTILPARHAQPADDRPGAGHSPALDAQRPADRFYLEAGGLPGTVLAAARTAPAATSGSSRATRTSSTCAPTAGRPTANSSCSARCRSSPRADRADRHRAPCGRDRAGVNRELDQHSRGRLSKRTLDRLLVEHIGSRRDLRRAVSRSSEIGSRSRPAAAGSRSGRVTAGNCSSPHWTVGRCSRSRSSRDDARLPGVRRCCSNSPCTDAGWISAVRRRRRWTVLDDPERRNGGDAGTGPNLILVQNWFEELKRLVPVN